MLPMQEVVLLGETLEFGQPGDGAVVVHDLGQHPGRIETGQMGQVDRRLGVAGPLEHPAGLVPKRIDVSGSGQVVGAACPGSIRTWMVRAAIGRRDAGSGPLSGIDAHGEGGAADVGAVEDHHRQVELVEPLPRHGHSEDAARVPDHEADLAPRVTWSAATIRSPSFSRSASSTTMTMSPRAMAAIRSSIGGKAHAKPLQQPLDVLGQDIELKVDQIARALQPRLVDLEGVRDQGDLESRLGRPR